MLRHGILGLINYNDKTGYELMKAFRHSLSHFWTAQTSQIYRELQTMEKLGWIYQTHVEQTGKPDKNIFSITEAGREELLRWLKDDNLPSGERSPLLMKTFFLGECTPEENLAFFRGLRQENAFPDGGKDALQHSEAYGRGLAHPEQAVYWRMTIRFAQLYEQMLHNWCDECINELEMMRRTDNNEAPEETV